MEHLVTPPAGSAVTTLTDVVLEAPSPCAAQEQRQRRILQLRDAIESGDYRVAASDLADALLRVARRAN